MTFGDVPDDLVEVFVGKHSDVGVGVVAQREEHVHGGAEVLRQLGRRTAEILTGAIKLKTKALRIMTIRTIALSTTALLHSENWIREYSREKYHCTLISRLTGLESAV